MIIKTRYLYLPFRRGGLCSKCLFKCLLVFSKCCGCLIRRCCSWCGSCPIRRHFSWFNSRFIRRCWRWCFLGQFAVKTPGNVRNRTFNPAAVVIDFTFVALNSKIATLLSLFRLDSVALVVCEKKQKNEMCQRKKLDACAYFMISKCKNCHR